jgi:hypothetical protein
MLTILYVCLYTCISHVSPSDCLMLLPHAQLPQNDMCMSQHVDVLTKVAAPPVVCLPRRVGRHKACRMLSPYDKQLNQVLLWCLLSAATSVM